MHKSDSSFFEAYKKLDKLCSDLCAEKNGISAYIAEMEYESSYGHSAVSSWDSDLKALKHVRWVRNRIAHDTEISRISESSDLAFVLDFHNRIISGQDSLALLRIAKESQRKKVRREQVSRSSRPKANVTSQLPKQTQASQTPKVSHVPDSPRFPENPRKKKNGVSSVLIGLIGILVILLLCAVVYKLKYS